MSVGAMSASTFGTLGFAALAPLERDEFGLSTFAVGSLTALVFLGALSASIPAGRLTDRVGAARTLAVSQVLLACGIGSPRRRRRRGSSSSAWRSPGSPTAG